MNYEKNLAIRILIAIALLAIPFNIFYFLFAKLTLYSSLPFLYFLGFSFKVKGLQLFIDGRTLSFVPACVATSAYYMLALLVLTIKDTKWKTMFALFLSGSFLILLLNVIRIDILLYILLNINENLFDKVHIVFWHFVSSIYVAAVWIFLAYKFKVNSIPVYSDFKYLLSKSVFGNKAKKKPKKGKKKSKKVKRKPKKKKS